MCEGYSREDQLTLVNRTKGSIKTSGYNKNEFQKVQEVYRDFKKLEGSSVAERIRGWGNVGSLKSPKSWKEIKKIVRQERVEKKYGK